MKMIMKMNTCFSKTLLLLLMARVAHAGGLAPEQPARDDASVSRGSADRPRTSGHLSFLPKSRRSEPEPEGALVELDTAPAPAAPAADEGAAAASARPVSSGLGHAAAVPEARPSEDESSPAAGVAAATTVAVAMKTTPPPTGGDESCMSKVSSCSKRTRKTPTAVRMPAHKGADAYSTPCSPSRFENSPLQIFGFSSSKPGAKEALQAEFGRILKIVDSLRENDPQSSVGTAGYTGSDARFPDHDHDRFHAFLAADADGSESEKVAPTAVDENIRMLGFSGSSSTSEVSEDEDGLIPGGGVTDAEYSIFPPASDGIFAKQLFEIYPLAFNTDASHVADVDSSVMKEIVVAVHFRNMILAYKTLLDRDRWGEKVDDEIAMLLDPPSPESSTERLLVDRFTGLGLGDCGTIGESGAVNWRPKNILRREQGQEQGPLRALGSSFYWALQPGYWSGVEQQNIRPPYTGGRAGGVEGQPAGVLTVSGREDILSCANRSPKWAEILLRSRDKSQTAPYMDIQLLLAISNSHTPATAPATSSFFNSSSGNKKAIGTAQLQEAATATPASTARVELFRDLYANWRVMEIVYALRVLRAFHGDEQRAGGRGEGFYLTVNLRAPDLLVDGLIFQDLKSLIEDCQQLEATQEATLEEITTASAEDHESSGEDKREQVGQGEGSFCHVQHRKSIFSKTVLQHLSKFLVLEVTEDISIAEVFERFGDPVEEFSLVLKQWKQELLPNVRFSLDDVVDVVGLEAQMITKRGGIGADERLARMGKLEEGAATSSAAPATSSSMKTFLAKSFNTAEFLVDAETEHRRRQRQLPRPPTTQSFNFDSETDRKRRPPPLFDIVKIDMDYAKSLFFAHPSLAAPWKRELVDRNFVAVDINHLKQCLLKELRGWAVDDLSGAWEVFDFPGVEADSSSPSFMLPFFSSWKTKASSTPYLKSCSSIKSVKLPNMQVLTKVRSQLEWEELAQLAEEDGTSDFRFITVSDYVKLLERFVELVAFTHDNGQDLVIELTLDANDRNIQKAFQMLNEIVLPGMETKEREQNEGAEVDIDMPISLKFWSQMETATQQGGASGAIAFRAQEVLKASSSDRDLLNY